jgi:hypothetical protein
LLEKYNAIMSSQGFAFHIRLNLGVEMKMKNMIGIAIIIVLMIHFTASGLVGFNGNGTGQTHLSKNTLPADAIQKTVISGEQHKQDRSIFSNVTIISLVLAVIGLIAFRRNTYS